VDRFEQLTVNELLRLNAGLLAELRRRDVVRSSNNPSGDYAEWLFSRAFGWTLESNSSSGHDAVDQNGTRYQIKCRRISAQNPSRQMSALRNLLNRPFDVLAALLLDENFAVSHAALIPIDIVVEKSTFTQHVNAHRFILRDSVWSIPGVIDVTDRLIQEQQSI
jgi:hypothetical protein